MEEVSQASGKRGGQGSNWMGGRKTQDKFSHELMRDGPLGTVKRSIRNTDFT